MNATKVEVQPPHLLPHRDVQDATKRMICVEPVSNHPSLSGHSPHSPTHDVSMPAEDEVQSKIERTKRRRREKSDGGAIAKVCAICGDQARNTHFGGVCCDSCKAFFRRAVQSNSYHKFYCSATKNCPIVKSRRRLCQYCRFQKCQRIGMEVGLVMTEAERIALWKKKLAKRRESSPKKDFDSFANCQVVTIAPLPGTSPDRCLKGATSEEVTTLGHLVTLQQSMFSSLPYPENCFGNTPETLANLFLHICFKIRSLFYCLEDFQDIPKEDQVCILRNGIAMSIYIHGAHNYDSINQRWPASGISEALRLPNITKETVKMFTIFPELYLSLMDFYNTYGDDMKDEAVVVLLSLIALFHDGNEMLIARERIHMLNNKYIALLRNYLVSKHGYDKGNAKVNKLLFSLFEIKKVVAFHSKVDVKPSIENNPNSSNGTAVHFQAQVTALAEAFRGKWLRGFSQYASAFTLEEKEELDFSHRFLELSFPHPKGSPEPKPDNCSTQYHHAFTKSIFGEESNTTTILSLADIFDCKRISEISIERNSFPQESLNMISFDKDNLERAELGEKENDLKSVLQ